MIQTRRYVQQPWLLVYTVSPFKDNIPHSQAVSFGAEALSPQAEEEAEDNGWQLAKHFKLQLHPPELKAKHGLTLDRKPASSLNF